MRMEVHEHIGELRLSTNIQGMRIHYRRNGACWFVKWMSFKRAFIYVTSIVSGNVGDTKIFPALIIFPLRFGPDI